MNRAALLLLFGCLALGTFATELTTALALVLALWAGDRDAMREPAAALGVLGVALAIAAVGGGPDAWREVPGRLWPLAPVLIVPALARGVDQRVERFALGVAGLVGLVAVVQRLRSGQATVAGPFSHHLTLGYALLPPLVVAVSRRRWVSASALGAGVVAAGGSGPVLAAVVGVIGVTAARPLGALLGGVGLTLGAITWLRGDPELHQRAILWLSGAWLAVDRPAGLGLVGFRSELAEVQDLLEPGFHFPLHAHDSALQLGLLAGLGNWIALGWLAVFLWRHTGRAGRAILAALAVGSLTQDVLGDLEVARALAAWVAWSGLVGAAGDGGPLPRAARPSQGAGGGEPAAAVGVQGRRPTPSSCLVTEPS